MYDGPTNTVSRFDTLRSYKHNHQWVRYLVVVSLACDAAGVGLEPIVTVDADEDEAGEALEKEGVMLSQEGEAVRRPFPLSHTLTP